jgi:hypothetical protein
MFVVDIDDVIFDTTNQMLKYYEITPPEGIYDRFEVFKDATEPLPLNFWEMLPYTDFADIILTMLLAESGFYTGHVSMKFEAVCKFARLCEFSNYVIPYIPTDRHIGKRFTIENSMLLTTSEDEVANWPGSYFLIPAPWNSAEGEVYSALSKFISSRKTMLKGN